MTYRVIQWATGAMGKTCLKAIIDHPGVDLAGLFVYGAGKVGKDAGEIARRGPTGVIATNNVEDILALDADVVVHAGRLAPPYGSHDREIIRLLESGKNVISINGYSHTRHWRGERLSALEAACAKGGASLMNAGLNPGFIAEQIAVVATGVCSELDRIEVVESVSGREIMQPEYAFGALGFGADPAANDPNDENWGPASALNGMYEEVVAAVADRLGMRLERIERDHRAYAAAEDLHVNAGVVPKGTISHLNWKWHGHVDGARKITHSIHWYMETAHLGEAAPPLWRVNIEGKPGLRIAVDLEKRPSEKERTSAEQFAVAGAVINAIPIVCAAPPGVISRPIATPFRADFR
ncbi:MAG: hypothetical protein KJZ75_17870 [Hyphomonadaceae bacterium]|nr:hypothetical protein [Hyphomonadaceae bacterium]